MIEPQHWHIRAARACTRQGQTPASLFASAVQARASFMPSDKPTHLRDGEPTHSYLCPIHEQLRDNRIPQLAARALIALRQYSNAWLEDAVLVLSLTDRTPRFITELSDSLHQQKALDLANWCTQAPLYWVQQPADWASVDAEHSLWLSADSLLSSTHLAALGERLADEDSGDGVVLGEGAAAFWLQKSASDYPKLTFYPQRLNNLRSQEPPCAGIAPWQDLLLNNFDSRPSQQARWYQWLAGYPQDERFDLEQHLWLNRCLGHPGCASTGIGLITALGRLNLDWPPQQHAWMLDQNLTDTYTLTQLTQGKIHVQ